jgi:dTDP-4-amino-4,6-dideoxygalactose transaminase
VEQLKKLNNIQTSQHMSRAEIISKINTFQLKYFLGEEVPTEKYEGTGMNLFLVAKSEECADSAIECAKSQGVLLKRLWSKPFHQLGVFEKRFQHISEKDCKTAEEAARCLLVVPIPPVLSADDIAKVCNALCEINKRNYFEGWF